jgi:hypothetical protein
VTETRPAFYALTPGGWRDYWTLLHVPYTLWHLSYVAIGAAMVSTLDLGRLGLALAAFFLAVGVGAHAFDELHGRPLRTRIPSGVLVGLGVFGLAGALALGVVGGVLVSWWVVPFMIVGGIAIPAYNLEWWDGRLHTALVFAVMWGGFPALMGAFAQTGRIDLPVLVVCAGCALLAGAQRHLSTPVRRLRRQVADVRGEIVLADGTREPLDHTALRAAPEGALQLMWIAMVALAVGLVLVRWP